MLVFAWFSRPQFAATDDSVNMRCSPCSPRHSPLPDIHTQGPTLAFPVPLALAPPHRRTYGRGELHARAARRLLLTQPAAPSPLPSCDALRFGAREAAPPLVLTMPATSRSQVRLLPSRSRETRPLPLVPHPYTERTRLIAPTLFRRESDAAHSLAIAARLQSERRGHVRACRRPRLDAHAATCCPYKT